MSHYVIAGLVCTGAAATIWVVHKSQTTERQVFFVFVFEGSNLMIHLF